jgi:diguanylate cyclase (GGDEF)-like protein/PAS domain S-box-containing protein
MTTPEKPRSRARGVARLRDSISQSSKQVQQPDDYAAEIVDTVRESLLVLDGNLRVISANRSFCRTFKVTPEETKGQSFYSLGSGQWDILKLQELMETLLQRNPTIEAYEVECDFPLIGRRVMCLNARKIHRKGQQAQTILLAIEDITDRKEVEQQTQKARVYAENIVETVREPLLILDREFRVVSANRSFYSTFQVTRDETENKPIYELGDKQWDIPALHLLEQTISTHNEVRDVEVTHYFPRIGYKTMLLNARKILEQAGQRQLILLAIEDITARKRAEEALFQEKERAEVTLKSIGDGVITTDAEGVVQYLNPVAATLTGWTVDEARGQPLTRVFHIVDEDHNPAPDPVARCLAEECITGLANHTILIRRDGKEFSIQDSVAPIRHRDGRILGAVLVFRDATEARRIGLQMAHQATHDALTGLVNREEFEHRLERVLETTRIQEADHAMCYMDLDQFKVINDTCGHAAGDELLRQIGRLLQQHVRERDTLARLGGDEFGLLMEHCSLKQAERVAHAVRAALQNFQFLWDKKTFSIGVSIGLVPITDTGEGISGVVRAADTACYAAKENGGNRIHVYGEDDPELAQRHGVTRWVTRINQALEEERFCLYFQPISPVVSGEMLGEHYELLLRMKDEEGRIVLPGAFLPAAERYDLATRLDGWVIHSMLEWLARHRDHLERLYLCEINLSGQSLGNEEFLRTVIREFDETNIPAEKICFEVTETAAIANLTRATHFIQTLKARGCRFALDDFGSGLSSFAYLKNLPVDFLKIDGVFVKNMVDDPTDLAMVKSINEIGHTMGKRTIAEFVESADILRKLKLPEIGVDYAQGYHIGRPRPITDIS